MVNGRAAGQVLLYVVFAKMVLNARCMLGYFLLYLKIFPGPVLHGKGRVVMMTRRVNVCTFMV